MAKEAKKKLKFKQTFLGDLVGADGKLGIQGKNLRESLAGARRKITPEVKKAVVTAAVKKKSTSATPKASTSSATLSKPKSDATLNKPKSDSGPTRISMPPRSSNTDKAYKPKEGPAKEPAGSGKNAKGLITLVAGGTGIAAIANAGSRISQSKKRAATRAAGVKAGQDAVSKAKAEAKTKARAVTKARTSSKVTPKVVTPTAADVSAVFRRWQDNPKASYTKAEMSIINQLRRQNPPKAATPVKVEPLKLTPEMRAKAAAADSTKATEAFKKKFASALKLKDEVPKLSASEKSLIKKLHANPKLKLTAAQNTVVQRLKSAVKGGGANMSISDLTGMFMGGGNISSIPDDNPFLN